MFDLLRRLYSFKTYYTKGGETALKAAVEDNLEPICVNLANLVKCSKDNVVAVWDSARWN